VKSDSRPGEPRRYRRGRTHRLENVVASIRMVYEPDRIPMTGVS